FYLKNEGTSTFWSIEFTYGLAGTTHAQGPFGPGGPYPLGYHRVEGLGAIEGWALAEGTIRRWHPTVDFNFPNTVNQAITLTHPSFFRGISARSLPRFSPSSRRPRRRRGRRRGRPR